MENFLNAIVWIIAVFSTVMTIVCSIVIIGYNKSAQKTIDNIRGIEREFYFWRWVIPAIIAWTWIFTSHLGQSN